jgi:poly-beta-1,6-N-acetyl-D-glucosamine N-deacetylase
MQVHFTLDDGPNTPDVPLTKIRRLLVAHDWDAGTLIDQMRLTASYRGERNPVERVVSVSLDEVYDVDPAKREEKLSRLLDRIKDLAPKSVFLSAYSDPDQTGVAQALYFPNRHMPMRADLFNRVAWQLITRAEVQVYARLPLLAFALPDAHPASKLTVQAVPAEHGAAQPVTVARLSPFDDVARGTIQDIYLDLARYASFNGLVFGQDATLSDREDASPAALSTYASWGLPADMAQIRTSHDLLDRWSKQKTAYLIEFTQNLANSVRDYQGGGNILTARALPSDSLFVANPDVSGSQNIDAFVAAYDFVALAANPASPDQRVSKAWLTKVSQAVAARPGATAKTIFELQSVDPRTKRPLDTAVLRTQLADLSATGVIHLAYGPDDFLGNKPDTTALRDVMSIQSSLHLSTRTNI